MYSHPYTTRSKRAGIFFPVGRVHRYLKRGKYASRIGAGAPVYLAAVMEYIAAEVLELSGNIARDNKKSRITPRHVKLAVHNDEELYKLIGKVTIPAGGVLPHIPTPLLYRGDGVLETRGYKKDHPRDYYECRKFARLNGKTPPTWPEYHKVRKNHKLNEEDVGWIEKWFTEWRQRP